MDTWGMVKWFALVLMSLGSIAAAQATEVWVGTYFQNTIQRFDIESGTPVGPVGGGPIGGPLGMARLGNGDVLAASETSNSLRRYGANGAFLGVFAGTGMNGPTAIAVNGQGDVFASNFNNNSVSRYSSTGVYLGNFIAPGGGGMNGPDIGATFGPDGNYYVPSFYDHRVLRFNGTSGAYLGDFIAAGSGGLTQPRQLIWRNGLLYVSSDSGNKVLRYNPATGAFVDTFVTAGSGGLNGAAGMAFVGTSLYVTSWRNGRVLKYNAATGAFQGIALSGLGSPVSIQVVPEPTTLSALLVGIIAKIRKLRRSV